MRSNQRHSHKANPSVFGFLLKPHSALLAFAALLVAVGYYAFEAQCTMYGNKMKDLEKTLSTLNGELSLEQYRWGRMRTPEELRRYSLARGIVMEGEPKAQQFTHVRKTAPGDPAPWTITYHPETKAAMADGGSPFEFVKALPRAGKTRKQ